MKKPSCKNELDEHKSEKIWKMSKKKMCDRRTDQIIAGFLPLVLIIYNICFLSTICFSLYFYSEQGSPDLGEFLTATATQILKYDNRYSCSIINFYEQNMKSLFAEYETVLA